LLGDDYGGRFIFSAALMFQWRVLAFYIVTKN